jgi:hypothetical protein
VVLDIFCDTGTTALVALQMGVPRDLDCCNGEGKGWSVLFSGKARGASPLRFATEHSRLFGQGQSGVWHRQDARCARIFCPSPDSDALQEKDRNTMQVRTAAGPTRTCALRSRCW